MAKKQRKKLTLANLSSNLGRVSWVGALLLVGALVVNAVNRKETAIISGIDISVEALAGTADNYLIDTSDVRAILQESFTKPLDQLRLAEIDMARVERVLERNPFVSEAEAFVDKNNGLRVKIEQRRPLLRVKDNNGLDYYLDVDGNRMPPSKHYAARVVVVTGNVAPWQKDFLLRENHNLHDIYQLAELLVTDEFLQALVEQIYLTNKGELVLSPKVGDQIIYLGRYDDEKTPERLERLKVFYRQGLPYEGWRKYKSFDLRYADQVVCTKR
ncbi:MAG: hypothetical protein WBA17_15610 [Saprospiraceae bacterium]